LIRSGLLHCFIFGRAQRDKLLVGLVPRNACRNRFRPVAQLVQSASLTRKRSMVRIHSGLPFPSISYARGNCQYFNRERKTGKSVGVPRLPALRVLHRAATPQGRRPTRKPLLDVSPRLRTQVSERYGNVTPTVWPAREIRDLIFCHPITPNCDARPCKD
jgi:hypothetical protein